MNFNVPQWLPSCHQFSFSPAPFSARPNSDGFSDVSDVSEVFSYAVRSPGWPSGPAAGPSWGITANLHFSKEFQRFPVVPQLPSVVFFSLLRAHSTTHECGKNTNPTARPDDRRPVTPRFARTQNTSRHDITHRRTTCGMCHLPRQMVGTRPEHRICVQDSQA